MTREEAIEELKEDIELYMPSDPVLLDRELPDGRLITALEMAIEALEQKTFINKPCVSSGVCEHDKNKVLDKVRAEIMSKDGLEEALEIIDKYKAESEDKE